MNRVRIKVKHRNEIDVEKLALALLALATELAEAGEVPPSKDPAIREESVHQDEKANEQTPPPKDSAA